METRGTPFKIGNPGKPKGAKNKVTNDLRSRISDFLTDEFDEIKADFKKLEPKDRLKFFTDLIQYSVPKLQAMQLETDFDRLTDDQLEDIVNELIKKDAA